MKYKLKIIGFIFIALFIFGAHFITPEIYADEGVDLSETETYFPEFNSINDSAIMPIMGLVPKVSFETKFVNAVKDDSQDSIVSEWGVFDSSKILLIITTTERINPNTYTLSARLTEHTNLIDSAKEVYLNLEALSSSSSTDIVNVETNEISLIPSNGQEINKIKNENFEISPLKKSNKDTLKEDQRPREEALHSISLPDFSEKIYVYSYIISLKDNENAIRSVFGNNFKTKKYILDVYLSNTFSKASQGRIEIDSEKYYLKFLNQNSKKNLSTEYYEEYIYQEQVIISKEQVPSELSQIVSKIKEKDVDVISLDSYEFYTDKDRNEMYVSNQEFVKKIIPINEVLTSHNIKPINVIGNIELVSVDDSLEYVLKIKVPRKLFGFIPFGTKEKYVSLDAVEDIEITD